MRKFISLIILCLISIVAFSQALPKIQVENQNQIKQDIFKSTKLINYFGYWYNYALRVNELLNQSGEINSTYLFPDTNIIAVDQSQIYRPWMHKALVVIDVESPWFNPNKPDDFKSSRVLDSVEIFGKYRRNFQDTNIVDTLLIRVMEIEKNYAVFDTFTVNPSYFGVNEISYIDLPLNLNINLNYYIKQTMKIPLTSAIANDTLGSGINHIRLKLDTFIFEPTHNNLYILNYEFLPGYSYSSSDTLNNMNYFQMYSIEEQGTNTFPGFDPNTYSASYVDYHDSYNINSDWYNKFIPSWAFNQAYSFENHIAGVSFSIYGGINETNGVFIYQNYPNPVEDKTSIEFNLKSNSELSIKIYNITGKLIFVENLGLYQSGKNKINLSLGHLSPGLYYYNLSTKQNKSNVKKMIVK